MQQTRDVRAWETAWSQAKLLAGKRVDPNEEFSWLGEQAEAGELTPEQEVQLFRMQAQAFNARLRERGEDGAADS